MDYNIIFSLRGNAMQKKYNKKARVVLITGAGRRIGAEIARFLHAQGINVVLHYYQSEKAAKTLCVALNKQRKNSAMVVQADLSIFDHLNLLIQKTVEFWGYLDVVVNNASVFYKTKIGKVKSDGWDELIDTNLKAPFFLAQAAFPYLAKRQGCIVNIADRHANHPLRDYSVYCISKAGLVMLTQALARELAPNVRVNAVSPGSIVWPEGGNSLSKAMQKKIIGRTALQRQGNALDIAKAVLFLIQEANYTTGQTIIVDGGRY
jgi:pteridine reductase